MKTKALSHIRVLDLSRVLAGPWCTQNLADLGAEVIKIERPGVGDDTRSWGPPWIKDGEGGDTRDSTYYAATNRGKKSVTVDMATAEGQALIRELAKSSDVLIENFKVGDLKRYGLDYASLADINPSLVYCTASVGSSQVPTAAVDNSAPSAIRPESTYKSGKVVQTSGATSAAGSLGEQAGVLLDQEDLAGRPDNGEVDLAEDRVGNSADANGPGERFTRAHCAIGWYHLSHIFQLEVRMLNVSAEAIGAVLGIRRKPKGIEDLMATIERGLPRAALDHTLAFLGTVPGVRRRELIGKVVSLATYKRRRTLHAAESEKVARIARVIAFARHVWDDDDAAREFLTTPHPMLSGKRPIDLAFSELGAIRVEHVLSGILHGAAA